MAPRNYSGSRCSNCKGSTFEAVNETPIGSTFVLLFVRCTSCKTVIGVLESHNINMVLRNFAKKLNINLDS